MAEKKNDLKTYEKPELESSCGLPKNSVTEKSGAYSTAGESHTFTLGPGDIGTCPGDHENNRERIEIKSNELSHGETYTVSFKAQFSDRSSSVKSTKFFQIHQYNKFGDHVLVNAPIFMLSIHTDDLKVTAQPLRYICNCDGKEISEHDFLPTDVSRQNMTQKEVTFEIEFTLKPKEMNTVRVSVNNQEKISCRAWVHPTGAPKLKFGLYRPGGNANPTDQITICDIKLKQH